MGPFAGGSYITAVCRETGLSTAGFKAHAITNSYGARPAREFQCSCTHCFAYDGRRKTHSHKGFEFFVGHATREASVQALKAAGGDARRVPVPPK